MIRISFHLSFNNMASRVFSGLVVLLFLQFSGHSYCNAQSFLSSQRKIIDSSSDGFIINVENTENSELKTTYKILETSVPLVGLISEADISDDSDIGANEEGKEGIALLNELDSVSLNNVSIQVDKGEYNLALSSLEKMSDQVSDQLDESEQFILKEKKLYLAIRVNFQLGRYEKVDELTRVYFKQYGNGEHYFWIFYYFAATLSYQEKPLEFVSLVTEDFFSYLPNREKLNLRKFLIKDALNSNQFLSALGFIEDSDGKLIKGHEEWAEDIIDQIRDIEDIDEILERYTSNRIKTYLYSKKIQLLIRNDNLQQAQDLYYKLLEDEDIHSEYFNELQVIQSFINTSANTEPHKIGVILPFSHRHFGRWAKEVQDGLELAMKTMALDGQPFQLVFKNSAKDDSNPELKKKSLKIRQEEKQKLVKEQIRELVEDEGVIAVLGPLAKSTSLAAGEAAEKYKIPVISFSKTENIGEHLSFLFRFQRNQIQEAKILANYAMDYLQAERFVIFYKSGKKGFEVMQAFGSEVKRKGGSIVGIARIHRKQVDFNDSFKSITGGFQKRTEEEEEELKKARERPKPIVDFDAIFLPVNTNLLKIITDFSRLFDADDAWILAGSEANVRRNQLLKNIKKLRFVDAFPISSVATILQPFFEDHWKYYNYRTNYYPPTNYTIYAYEALEIVGKLLGNPQFRNREALRDAIQNMQSFPVLTGMVSSLESRELVKEQKILKLKGSNTVKVFK